jgi:peptidoglycan L-alanyl-D-glutamate endopeptidase CwlK
MTDETIISNLDPDFIPKVQALKLELLKQTGYNWLVVQGRRTIAEQNALYAKGRTAGGSVVTNAKGGSSPHNFGLAVDMVPIINGALGWNYHDRGFQQAADIAKDMGLMPGYYFHSIHDPDHFEDPNWKAQQALWQEGKLTVA